MCFGTQESLCTVVVHRGTEEQSEYPTHLLVEFLSGTFSLQYLIFICISKVIQVVGIRHSVSHTVGPRAELHIQTISDSLIGVMCSAPVAKHHTVEPPVVLKNLIKKYGIMTAVLTLIAVIGTHESPHPAFLYGSFECRKVNLVQRSVANHNIHVESVLLVVVQGIVFNTRCHSGALQSLNVRYHHSRHQIRVFTHIFEVASVKRSAVDVHSRTQYHILSTIACLLTETNTIETCHLRVPCSCKTSQRGESHTRVVGLSSLFPLVPQHVGTYSVRSVVSPEVWQS